MHAKVGLGGGADNTDAGAADLTLARYPATSTSASATFSFHVPRNIPAGKTWYLRATFLCPSGADVFTINYYLSAYRAGDSYGGWNKALNQHWGLFTTGNANQRYESEKSIGAVIDAGDIVTIGLVKSGASTYDLHVVGLQLYWR